MLSCIRLIRVPPCLWLALTLAACGGQAVIDGSSGDGDPTTTSTTSPGSTTSSTTTTLTETGTFAQCSQSDDFCTCAVSMGCSPVSAGCLCSCDYMCSGDPPCECGCGGGDYLGCAPDDCPQLGFSPGDDVAFDDDGCPYLVSD